VGFLSRSTAGGNNEGLKDGADPLSMNVTCPLNTLDCLPFRRNGFVFLPNASELLLFGCRGRDLNINVFEICNSGLIHCNTHSGFAGRGGAILVDDSGDGEGKRHGLCLALRASNQSGATLQAGEAKQGDSQE